MIRKVNPPMPVLLSQQNQNKRNSVPGLEVNKVIKKESLNFSEILKIYMSPSKK